MPPSTNRADCDASPVSYNPGGVFALWSDDPPDRAFVTVLEKVFVSCEAHVVTFPNFNTDGEAASTVYLATVGQAA